MAKFLANRFPDPIDCQILTRRWWNHALRSAQHYLKNHVGSFSQANKLSSSAMISTTLKHEKANQSEESLKTVMYLSCWGPN
ncbi:hypothetical protein D0Y65_016186 [Glycine soja]|uniref:Uncharacterized protein n=1 Tax=Glycine soja TaxID=3848 RepID=A0A445KGI2_GLYSO|nr:hypothetical protein D0Y65_016186 [Glycine soja]